MAPAQNGPASKKDLGGDDLGTMDEVRVFKDEGEIEEEDASDLLYDKELKLLLEDHKRVMKFTMLFSMAMLFA